MTDERIADARAYYLVAWRRYMIDARRWKRRRADRFSALWCAAYYRRLIAQLPKPSHH